MFDKFPHEGENVVVVGGGGQNQLAVPEGVCHRLGHVAAGQVPDNHLLPGGLHRLGLLLFQQLNLLGHVDAREKDVPLVHGHLGTQRAKTAGSTPLPLLPAGADLIQQLFCGARYKRLQQNTRDSQRLKQVVHNRRQARPVFRILGQHPRRGFINVLVSTTNQLPNSCQRFSKPCFVHQFFILSNYITSSLF